MRRNLGRNTRKENFSTRRGGVQRGAQNAQRGLEHREGRPELQLDIGLGFKHGHVEDVSAEMQRKKISTD